MFSPLPGVEDHGQGDHAPEDGREAEGIEGHGTPDPGPDAGKQFDVSGSHSADRVGRQQQEQPDGGTQEAPTESGPAEIGGAVDPAADHQWKGDPTDEFPNPRVNDQWNGQVDYSEDENDTGMVDQTTTEEEPQATPEAVDENDLEALGAAADGGSDEAVSDLTEKATLLDITQEQLDNTPSWAGVVELIELAEKSEKGAEEAFPTFVELGVKADEDDEEAQAALTEAAKARLLNPDEYPTWEELAVELEKAPEVSNESNNKPEKKEVWWYKPPRKQKRVECEVTTVFDGKETCNLKNLDDGSSYKSVAWSELHVGA